MNLYKCVRYVCMHVCACVCMYVCGVHTYACSYVKARRYVCMIVAAYKCGLLYY